jgi:glycosyltransferase involved in cell wall biosynthesis
MKKHAANRVLLLLENSYYPRDARVRREAESLAEAGFEVTVICPALRAQPKREMLNEVRVWRFTPAPEARGLLGYALEYGYALAATLVLSIRLAFRYGFDVLHAANPPDLFVLIAAVYKPFGKRFIYDQHDLAPEMYQARFAGRSLPLVRTVLLGFERLSYFFADHVIVTNESYRTIAMSRGRVPAERISIVRNGPDEKQLAYKAAPAPELYRPGMTGITYLGLMGVQDGVKHLIQALHHLRRDLAREDFWCLLLGCGEEQGDLEEMVRQLDLGNHVKFAGFIPDPDYIPFVLAADICVDPDPSSEYNDRSTMVKIMDYMTFGKPLVAFDLPENRFSAGDAAVYVKPNDDLEFARALARLMDRPEERLRMGTAGRRRIEAELAWCYSAHSLLSAYAAMAPRPERNAPPCAAPAEQDRC